MANQKIVPLDQVDPQSSPYFSLIIVPGKMAGLNMHRRPNRHPRPGQPGHRAAYPAGYPRPRSMASQGVSRAPTVVRAFGDTLRSLYQQDTPIIALCAAGIVIRSLALCSARRARAAGAGRGRGRQRGGAAARWPRRGERDGAGNR
jgi:hypothetical protein